MKKRNNTIKRILKIFIKKGKDNMEDLFLNLKYRLDPISKSDSMINAIVSRRFSKHIAGKVTVTINNSTAILQDFHVETADQHSGIGHMLLSYSIKHLKKIGVKKLYVYPVPKGVLKGDIPIRDMKKRISTLYTIYEHLGFVLDDEHIDRTTSGHRMTLTIH